MNNLVFVFLQLRKLSYTFICTGYKSKLCWNVKYIPNYLPMKYNHPSIRFIYTQMIPKQTIITKSKNLTHIDPKMSSNIEDGKMCNINKAKISTQIYQQGNYIGGQIKYQKRNFSDLFPNSIFYFHFISLLVLFWHSYTMRQ